MWDKLTRRHSPRGKALLCASLVCCMFGIAYTPLSNLPSVLPMGLDVVSRFVPLWVFGACWLTVGLAGVGVFFARRIGAAVFAAQFALFSIWASCYAVAWVFGGDPRAWITAGMTGGFAGMVAFATRVEPPMWFPVRFRRPSWKR